MMHIEFLGQPGAGKSTIHSKLIESGALYGGTKQDAVRRIFFKKATPKQRAIYKLAPNPVLSFLEDNFLEYRFGHNAIEEFIIDFPNYIKMVSVAMDSVTFEPEKVFSLCRRSAEQYQLGASTVSEKELLCLDESFAQRAFSILWRRPNNSFSIHDYINTVPIPTLLIHVDAPIDLCLERQQDRGRMTVAKEWETNEPKQVQNKSRNICNDIREYWAEETSVLTIENTGTVEAAVEQILSEVSELSA